MITRTDNDGEWISLDDGTTWTLAKPSEAWLTAKAALSSQEWPDQADPTTEALRAVKEEFQANLATMGTVSAAKVRDALVSAFAQVIEGGQ